MRRHKMLTSVFLAGTTLALACGGDDGSGPPPANAPVVTSLDTTTVSPGDTLIISGSHFSATPGENTVTFRNPLSGTKPFAATTSRLSVIVDVDATTGPVTVATSAGSGKSSQTVTVKREVGDVFVYGGLGSNNPLTLPNPGATTKYLLIPHGASTNIAPDTDIDYVVQSATTTPVVASKAQTAGATRELHAGARERFEAIRWQHAEEDFERYGAPRGAFQRKPDMAAQVAPQFKQFYVLNTSTGDQNSAANYSQITGQLKYEGAKCLVYADVDTLSNGNFTQAHFNLFGQTYDNSIEATNVLYFGNYSDVNGDGKVILLVTPVVNRLQEGSCSPNPCACGFIAGFFNPRDLYGSPPVPSGTTNHAEVLYLLAADPTGVWDCQFPVAATAAENLGTIPHEHEHLTSFSYRLLHGGPAQVRWLEEGMAHMAEDLNGDNSSNINRGELYRQDPGAISLEGDDTLEQRGGIYLMLRLITDRYGTGILKQLVQSSCTGRACIQNATGKGFFDVFTEFLAAQYVSGAGITDDERYNYTSIDINDFGPLLVGARVAGAGNLNDTTHRSAGDFFVFSGVLNQDSKFTFLDPGNGGLRSVVVRIE